jgi:CRP/FNR family transcriptional regulator, cyclic AMP receptor protein
MTTDVQLMDISCAGSCWINPMTRHAFGPRLKSAKTEIMRNKGWLSHTPKRFQNEILARSSFCEFKAGHQIYNVGDPPGGMYGLIDGGLAIAVANGERVFDFAHFASAGSWFGEASAFTDMPRRVGLRCTRQSSLLHLSQVEIKAVTHENPESWRWLALIALGHLDTAVGAAEDLMNRDPKRRCLGTLLRLAGLRHQGSTDEYARIDVSQNQLADMANLSRNAVGSILREAEILGAIKLGYKSIEILHPEALRSSLRE